MPPRLFIVDVEASNKTPHSGVMTEFGVVDFETGAWFHGHLWDFTSHPENPALPVPTRRNCGITIHDGTTTTTTHDPNARDHEYGLDIHEQAVFEDLTTWMATRTGPDGRAVFVSDNPGFDFMWMANGFDKHGLDNPFGFSSRRIGDLAAGLSGNWRNTNAWKKHRKTTHDHNPVNDALGNAEALRTVLRRHQQIDK